jgi:hypothetical protein
VTVGERTYGIDDCEMYAPPFTPEFIEVLRRVVPPERRAALARSLVFVGRKPRVRSTQMRVCARRRPALESVGV